MTLMLAARVPHVSFHPRIGHGQVVFLRHHGQMTDRAAVSRWLAEYEAAWRIMQLGGDGRCDSFEEWPFWPGRPHAPVD
jgi:hypothetical protein